MGLGEGHLARHMYNGVVDSTSVKCHFACFEVNVVPLVGFGSSWGGVLQFLVCCACLPELQSITCPCRSSLRDCGPVQAEVDMPSPLGELPLGTVWCLLVLCLLELRLRSGGDVANLAGDDGCGTLGDDPLHDAVPLTLLPDDMPSLTSDGLGEEQDDLMDILYDPFDRPEGEVIERASSPSRSRSPRRA